jgi:hypothetical protein
MFDQLTFSTTLVPIIAGSFIISIIPVFRWLRRAGNKYPPGPKGIPFFGNLFQLSKQDFEEWGHKYGKGLSCLAISRYLDDERYACRRYDVSGSLRARHTAVEFAHSGR